MMFDFRKIFLTATFLLLSGCGQPSHRVDLTLEDGTHVGGLLVAVEPDWLVLDRSVSTADPDIMLVDYSVVDTVTVSEKMSSGQRAGISLVGAAVGGLAGYWAGEGYLPDSSRPADPRKDSRATVGTFAGIAVGGLLSYFLATELGSKDIVFPDPNGDDYDSISTFAKYPFGLPADLRMALDSGWDWESKKDEK